MQNQRNAGNRDFRSGNRFSNDNFEGNSGRVYQDRYSQNRYDRSGQDYDRGFRSRTEDWDDRDANNYGDNQRYGNFSSNDWQDEGGRNGYSSRGYEEDYEDVTENYGRYGGDRNGYGRNYGSQYNQQGNRRHGSNGRGYNELSGGRNDQYDRDRNDDWNRGSWGSDRNISSDRNSNNEYNSFDRYADRGNYNTSRSGGGGYGSTSNRYEDSSSRNNQSARYGSDMYGSYDSGNSDWQNGQQRQRNSRRGFGSMSSERRGSLNAQGRREAQSNR